MKVLIGRLQIFVLAVAIVALPFSRLACSGALLVFLALWVMEGRWREKFDRFRENKMFVGLFCIWLMVGLLGIAMAADTYAEVMMLKKKAFLFLLPIAFATTANPVVGNRRDGLLLVFVTTCLVSSIVALIIAFNQQVVAPTYLPPDFQYADADGRWANISYVALAGAIRLHPTYFSLYLAASIIVVYAWMHKWRGAIRTAALMAAMFFFIVVLCLLCSRVVIFAMALLAVASIIFDVVQRRKFYFRVPVVALLLVVVLISLNPIARYRNIDDILYSTLKILPNQIYEHASDMRFALWWVAGKSISSMNPLVGTGVSDVLTTMEASASQHRIANTLGTYDPHNQFLFEMLSHGLVGFACLVICLGWLLVAALMDRNFTAAAFSFLIIAVCCTESILEVQKGIVFFGLFVPLIMIPKTNPFQLFHAQRLIAHAEK